METQKHLRHGHRRPTRSGLFYVLRDVALLVAAMNVFALFHHVLPRKLTPAGDMQTVSAAKGADPSPLSPTQTVFLSAEATASVSGAVPSPAPTLAPTPVPGDFSAAFPTFDTGKGALYSCQTDSVRIAVNKIEKNSVTYFVADVYIKSIEALKTAFARDTYGKNIYAFPTKTAVNSGAVFAVTGDYYSARSKGVVARNGELYRDVPGESCCVLYKNGEMKTYTGETPDLTDFASQSIWQIWSFGPALLTDDGAKINEFTTSLNDRNPRCGVGYYAPGHYCFIVVDGRQKGYSIGVRLTEFSAIFEKLGCRQAYNLDGGATAIMMWNGEVINKPYKGGRESGDIIYFA